MKRLLLLASVLPLSGCAVPSGDPDAASAATPMLQDYHIHLHTDGVRLGGYTVVVKWDPTVAVIERIRLAAGSKFPGRPEHPGSASFIKGSIRIWSMTTDREHEVREEYNLVTVTFKGLKPGTTLKPEVQVEALYDTGRRPKPITGRLNLFPAELKFGP